MAGKCFNCGLANTRRNQVIGRGVTPADVLFIGEAPGRTEDLLGEPFIGPSGRLLNNIIADVFKISEDIPSFTFYITNIVQCRPCESLIGENREPSPDEIVACSPNLNKVCEEVRPKLVIALGKVAEQECKRRRMGAYGLPHPAYIARIGGKESPEYRKTVVKLYNLLKGLYDVPSTTI